MRLPRPGNRRLDTTYVESLVSAIERELQAKADRQAGVVYVNENQPLVVIATDGVQYRIGVDSAGALTLTEIPT